MFKLPSKSGMIAKALVATALTAGMVASGTVAANAASLPASNQYIVTKSKHIKYDVFTQPTSTKKVKTNLNGYNYTLYATYRVKLFQVNNKKVYINRTTDVYHNMVLFEALNKSNGAPLTSYSSLTALKKKINSVLDMTTTQAKRASGYYYLSDARKEAARIMTQDTFDQVYRWIKDNPGYTGELANAAKWKSTHPDTIAFKGSVTVSGTPGNYKVVGTDENDNYSYTLVGPPIL